MSTMHYDWRRISGTVIASGSNGTMDLPEGMAEEVRQVICEPTISNNMYTFRLINKDDNDMVMWTRDVDGKLDELVSLPIYGNYGVVITDQASSDTFKVRLLYR